jgi:hypothetical protein
VELDKVEVMGVSICKPIQRDLGKRKRIANVEVLIILLYVS